MTELTPGLELDLAIARACGFEVRVRHHLGTGEPLDLVLDASGNYFHPSTDLNCAFEAAETVGLFDRFALTVLSGTWRITPAVSGLWFVDPVLATGSTPALAICAAILKLKEQH